MPYFLKGRDPTFVYDETHSLVGTVDASGNVRRFDSKIYFANQNILKPVVHTASTFVTLTIAAGATAAKTRLTSAGAHGLTGAISTGKYVYVSWAGATTAPNGLYVCTVASTDTTGLFIDIDLPWRAVTTTISVSSPAIFTGAAHGFVVGEAVRLSTTGVLPTGLNTSSNYYVRRVLSSSTFTVSLTPTSAEMVTTAAGSGTHVVFNSYGTPTVACVTQSALVFNETVDGGMISPDGCVETDTWVGTLSDANQKFTRVTYCGMPLYYNLLTTSLSMWTTNMAMYYSPTQLIRGVTSAQAPGSYNATPALVTCPHNLPGLLTVSFENAAADSPMTLLGFRAKFS